MNKYDRANNCEKLTVPRINPDIYGSSFRPEISKLPESSGCSWSCLNPID